MNPIYKFELSAGEESRQAFPVYKDDLAIDYALEQNQEFYRGKLSGKLTFQRDDYTFIRAKSFDTQFDVVISISYDGGQTWAVYWSGQFWKTDCQFNEDDQTAIVTPNVNDRYNAVLAGMEKEYNLIDLAPAMQPVKLDKRPMIQVYVPGQSVIGCFLSGMWWEQDCEAVDDQSALQNTYHFWPVKSVRVVDVTQQGNPVIPEIYYGEPYAAGYGTTDYTNGAYMFRRAYYGGSGGAAEYFYIVRVSDGQLMWFVSFVNQAPKTYPIELTLNPVEGSGATGNVKIYIHDIVVFARYVTDVAHYTGLNLFPIPDDDIVENNRNYHYCTGYDFPETIWFSSRLTSTPNKWGLYQPGQYYQEPYLYWTPELFPVARAGWGRLSIWFTFDAFDWILEEKFRKEYTLKDAYPIWSVIAVLLAKIAPGISHAGTTDYSRFLYDTNPLEYIDQRLFITPKSNLIASGYDQPAQKAPITLKRVTDMLRDCFRCYWFIDENNKFRIEHISYFMRGGSYSGTPVVGMDLTALKVTRNGKPWSYVRNQYQFDKPEMAARYQFGWMDDVTELFDGFPIDIISKYVNPENIEQIDVSQFTSDVDYILLNPGDVSKDGFVLLGASYVDYGPNQLSISGSDVGKYMYNENGDVSTNPECLLTNFIQIDEKGLVINGVALYFTSNVYVGYYDANQNLITARPTTEMIELTPAGYVLRYAFNASFVRITIRGYSEESATTWTVKQIIDGFVLPYVNFQYNGDDHILQNAWCAFAYLQRYYLYDMPARNVEINGVQQIVQGIKKLKTQTIKFPVLTEPNLTNLIKTELGNGVIQKMSVNLSSRNANTTLKYDTE